MRVLVLGGTGAVGTAAAAALEARGHEAVIAGRSVPDTQLRTARLDARTQAGQERARDAAARCDAVIDASGLEDSGIVEWLPGIPIVDISASGAHLDALRRRSGTSTIVLGAGIAPGVTTLLAAALDPKRGEDIDISVMLGTGEQHGPAAVSWTADLAGRPVYRAPEGDSVRIGNLRSGKRFAVPGGTRLHLRADFPDHVLLAGTGAKIRSYLALSSPLATAALGFVGMVPAARGLLAAAPHWGDDRWRVAATRRSTGERIAASGSGQSRATGEFAALAAIRAAEQASRGAVSMADLFGLEVLSEAASVTGRA